MCGRFVVARTIGEIAMIFEADEVIGDFNLPSYNLAPTQNVPVLVDRAFERDEHGNPLGDLSREFHSARWGLVPRWSKGPGEMAPLFNARIETLFEKPSFKDSVLRRRCLIPASGYFEWQVDAEGNKKAIYINAGDEGMFAFAALYDWWADPTKPAGAPDRWLLSASIVTKASAPELAHIHDRNPVLLSPDSLDEWLDPSADASPELLDAVAAVADEVASEALFHQVGPEVGKVGSNGPTLIRPIG
jgi:putative SOS response-associated peptidase YedK